LYCAPGRRWQGPNANGVYYVDDAVNTLNLFH
jgi:hypothetical protein